MFRTGNSVAEFVTVVAPITGGDGGVVSVLKWEDRKLSPPAK
jgi:hypothetical protein